MPLTFQMPEIDSRLIERVMERVRLNRDAIIRAFAAFPTVGIARTKSLSSSGGPPLGGTPVLPGGRASFPQGDTMTVLTPLPDVVPEELPEGTLLIEAVDDGNFMERANVAWLTAMTEAIKRCAKASITMTVIIEPAKTDDEDEREQPFKISTKVRLTLPNVENRGVFVPDEDGVIRTDLRTIRHVLRPLGDGRFANQRGEETDEAGVVVASSTPVRLAGSGS